VFIGWLPDDDPQYEPTPATSGADRPRRYPAPGRVSTWRGEGGDVLRKDVSTSTKAGARCELRHQRQHEC